MQEEINVVGFTEEFVNYIQDLQNDKISFEELCDLLEKQGKGNVINFQQDYSVAMVYPEKK